MHISKIELKNFKRFSEVGIDFSKEITILVGPNSSGKSSIIKSILALKHTASPSNENEVFATQGDYVDLGVYRDYVFNHEVKNKIEISPVLNGSLSGFPLGVFGIKKMRMSLVFDHDHATEQARLIEMHASDEETSDKILSITKKKTRDSFLLKIPSEYGGKILEKLFSKKQTHEYQGTIDAWDNGISVRIDDRYVVRPEKSRSTNKEAFHGLDIPVTMARGIFENLFRALEREFFYIGPLRRSPLRSYARTGHLLSVGPAGEHTPSVLANLKARAAKERSSTPTHRPRLQQFQDWMKLLFPGRTVDARSLDELVKLSIGRTGIHADAISDVGFGISQVIPILVQIAVMPDGSTLLIEQPELHLHPSVQTKLADVLVMASNSGRRFVVETHSEHFVRGLQLAVSNERVRSRTKPRLTAENLSFLYVPAAPAQPVEMHLNEWGEFKEEWPKGFFDEAYRLALTLLQNKMKTLSESQAPSTGSKS